MKKFLVAALLVTALATVQPAQAGVSLGLDLGLPYGIGWSLGYSVSVTPLIEIGAEYSSLSISGSQTASAGGTTTATLTGTRYGGILKLNLPVFPLKIHAGLHSGSLTATQAINFPGTTQSISQGAGISGSYLDVGLEYKLGVVFIEPRIGVQTITAQGTTYNLPFPSDAGLRLGLAF